MNAGERNAGYPNSPGLANLPAGYGLSHGELESLRKAQAVGNVKLVDAIGDDDEYKVPEHDFLFVYHVLTETPVYNRSTGEREDRGEVIQQYNVPAFKHMEKNGGFRGTQIVILHNPELAQKYVASMQAGEDSVKDEPTGEPIKGEPATGAPAQIPGAVNDSPNEDRKL